jgi:L-ascorbate metabolism protein UlaG (beta-lactamase superfamily)
VGLEITWLGHASVLIELDGARLLTDPLVRRRAGPLVRIAPPVDPATTRGSDAVVISHLHGDHMHLPSLRRIERLGPLVAPAGAARWLERHGQRDVHEVRAGDEVRVGAVQVVAVPAEHGDTRGHPFGPKAAPLGYVMRGSGSVHFAGDTDLYESMADLRGTIDVALVPVWGWGPSIGPGHLDPPRAVRAVQLIGARVAIPIHWGTYAVPRIVRRNARGDGPAREFAALAARDIPDVGVHLLQPGERLTL